MKGLILAAGRSQRMQDLSSHRNKVLLDLGDGVALLDNLLSLAEDVGLGPVYVTVGHDARTVKQRLAGRAVPLLNPFYEHSGVLSSLWVARAELYATDFLVTVGDHYLEQARFKAFLGCEPDAPIVVDVELKNCDDEDMKVFVGPDGSLRDMSKRWGKNSGSAVGEFTGMARFSSVGSRLFFDVLAELAWKNGLPQELYMADVLLACNERDPLAFHLSHDHRRMDVDYPSDYQRACELHRDRPCQLTPRTERLKTGANSARGAAMAA